jgi:hypothetical protein
MNIEYSSTVSPTTQIALNAPAPVVFGFKIYDTSEGFVLWQNSSSNTSI